jgi:hypothetical protein
VAELHLLVRSLAEKHQTSLGAVLASLSELTAAVHGLAAAQKQQACTQATQWALGHLDDDQRTQFIYYDGYEIVSARAFLKEVLASFILDRGVWIPSSFYVGGYSNNTPETRAAFRVKLCGLIRSMTGQEPRCVEETNKEGEHQYIIYHT